MKTQNEAKAKFKLASEVERRGHRYEMGLPVNASGVRVIRLPLLLLAESIRREVAPQLEQAREIDSFIASGKSLVGWLKEKATPAKLPAWARLQAPALPVGLRMPPNVCTNPAFNV